MALGPSSANWKIDCAVELLYGLDSEVIAWQDTKPYSFYTNIDPGFTRATINVKEHNPPQIIRSVSDRSRHYSQSSVRFRHSFWALLQTEFPTGLPNGTERLSFPIWDHPPNANQRGNSSHLEERSVTLWSLCSPTIIPTHGFQCIPWLSSGTSTTRTNTSFCSRSCLRFLRSELRSPGFGKITHQAAWQYIEANSKTAWKLR